MDAWLKVFRRRALVAAVLLLCTQAQTHAQSPKQPSTQTPAQPTASPPSLISMEDAIRIALAYNQALQAQQLQYRRVQSQGEITAGLKPNPTLSTLVDTIPIFSPQTIRFNTCRFIRRV